MTLSANRFWLLMCAVSALVGCMPADGFPSLSPRPGERDLSTEPPTQVQVDVASDPALRSRIADLVQQAERSEQAFLEAMRVAEASIRRASTVGSTSWVEAQEKLSLAEAARHPAATALGNLHQLAIERADLPTNPDDIVALDYAMARVAAQLALQQARLDILKASLPDPAS